MYVVLCITARAGLSDQIYEHSSYAPLVCCKMSNSDPKTRQQRPGPWPPAPESKPVAPTSWAKKTGFKPKFSGETNASESGQISLPPRPREPEAQPDLQAGRTQAPPAVNGEADGGKVPPSSNKDQTVKKRRDSDGLSKSLVPSTNGQAPPAATVAAAAPGDQPSQPRRTSRHEEVIDVLPQTVDGDGFVARQSHMKYELRDSPGLGTFD